MSTLLLKNIRTLVSCDDNDKVYENVDLYAEDGFIREIGTALDRKADRVIHAENMLCYPGLVNTHHHLYQVFSRNLPEVQNMERSMRSGRTSTPTSSVFPPSPAWAS